MNFKFYDTIVIPIDNITISGELIIPENSRALVLFSHGSGSSRFSPRNNFVAKELNKKGISTFLFDLWTKEEDEEYKNRFNIDLLSNRLIQVTKHIASLPVASNLNIGYFGASTGVASAINAAIALPDLIQAVVSRGGRPDLAMYEIERLKAPTLLIAGELDYDVIALNKKVYDSMTCEKEMTIVKDASHLFEEQGTMNKVALNAILWFNKYLMVGQKHFS